MSKRDTAEQILDVAQDFIQIRGFNAFSYQCIADKIGIRKASIHYHFPSKFDLGRAVIARYRQHLAGLMGQAELSPDADFWGVLSCYFEPYFEFARTGKKVCLCGALSGEFPALSKEMQDEVRGFFNEHQKWLAKLFALGRDAGAFKFAGDPGPLAKTFFGALQGGLLIERAIGDRKHLQQVSAILKDMLRGGV